MKDKNLIIGLVVVAIIVIAGVFYLKTTSGNPGVIGKYDCKPYSSSGDTSSYKISLELNKDKTFIYGPYNDLKNNHYKGTYTSEKEDKTMENMEYYMVSLKASEFMEDGKISDKTDFSAKMEFALSREKKKKEGVIIFTSSYNMYYCYER